MLSQTMLNPVGQTRCISHQRTPTHSSNVRGTPTQGVHQDLVRIHCATWSQCGEVCLLRLVMSRETEQHRPRESVEKQRNHVRQWRQHTHIRAGHCGGAVSEIRSCLHWYHNSRRAKPNVAHPRIPSQEIPPANIRYNRSLYTGTPAADNGVQVDIRSEGVCRKTLCRVAVSAADQATYALRRQSRRCLFASERSCLLRSTALDSVHHQIR